MIHIDKGYLNFFCFRGIDVLMDLQENNLEQRPAKNFITNYFKKLKKIVEERDKNERFSSFSVTYQIIPFFFILMNLI